MKHTDKVMSTAAAFAALSSLACCLPPAIMAAAGIAGLGVVIAPLAPWMLGLSVVFLTIGLAQLYRSGKTCPTRSRMGLVIFSVAAAVVLGITLFPQFVAGLLADGGF